MIPRVFVKANLNVLLKKSGGKNMALLVCPDCGGKVSSRADACPHCGCPIEYILCEDDNSENTTDFPSELDYCQDESSNTDSFVSIGDCNIRYLSSSEILFANSSSLCRFNSSTGEIKILNADLPDTPAIGAFGEVFYCFGSSQGIIRVCHGINQTGNRFVVPVVPKWCQMLM